MKEVDMEGKNEYREKIVSNSAEWHREKIVNILDKVKDVESLKRIYDLSEYLYIHR